MHRLLSLIAALLAALVLASGPTSAAAESATTAVVDAEGNLVTALYNGQTINPQEASHYFCHTRDYPVVRCFDSQAEVDADLEWVEPQEPGRPDSASASVLPGMTLEDAPDWSGGAYTIAYWDINYGGTALTLFGYVSNLGLLGWNDNISSFKSVNCGVPRYYVDPNYGGTYWQNGCDAWSPNLYSYNDTFSSVVNEAP